MRPDVSAVDVLMMVKGVCEASRSFQHVDPDDRHAPARPGPGRDLRPRRRSARCAGDGRRSTTSSAGATPAAEAQRPSGSRPSRGTRSSAARRSVPRDHSPSSANSVGVVTTPARTPERKSRCTRSSTASLRRSASKRSRSSPSVRGALPQVGILQPGLIGEQRVVHLPEAALARGCLGRAGRRPGPRMTGADREVAEHQPDRQVGQALVQGSAVGTLEVGVLDQQHAGRPGRGRGRRPGRRDRRRAARSAHGRPGRRRAGPDGPPAQPPRASKIRLAPGRSPGEGPDSSSARRRRAR